MRILARIVVNLRAAGPAAVLVAWIICVTPLGLFGEGPLAKTAVGILSVAGGVLVAALASRAES
jgi:hypothetical protein